MIRDGLTLKKKMVRKGTKSIKKRKYKENLFSSVIQAIKTYEITKIGKSFAYIRDPYGIMYLLDPFGINLTPDQLIGGVEEAEITCKEFFEAIEDGKIDEILPRMTAEEKLWCDGIANNRFKINRTEVLRAITYDLGIPWEEVKKVWSFQPDPIPIAFALGSDRLKVERLTPVIGIPFEIIASGFREEFLRFPCGVISDENNFKYLQIHKDGDVFKVFDLEKNEITNSFLPFWTDFFKKIGISYAVEARLNQKGDLEVTDILCWNDLWIYDQPYYERRKFLWHFEPFTSTYIQCNDHEDLKVALKEFHSNAVVMNLNKAYDPRRHDSHIMINRELEEVTLRVGGKRGGRGKAFLNTFDKHPVFEVPIKIDKEDWGDYVRVSASGKVSKVASTGYADSWADVAKIFDLPMDYTEYRKNKTLPKCKWIEEKPEEEGERNPSSG